jgi:hypothetical protein
MLQEPSVTTILANRHCHRLRRGAFQQITVTPRNSTPRKSSYPPIMRIISDFGIGFSRDKHSLNSGYAPIEGARISGQSLGIKQFCSVHTAEVVTHVTYPGVATIPTPVVRVPPTIDSSLHVSHGTRRLCALRKSSHNAGEHLRHAPSNPSGLADRRRRFRRYASPLHGT